MLSSLQDQQSSLLARSHNRDRNLLRPPPEMYKNKKPPRLTATCHAKAPSIACTTMNRQVVTAPKKKKSDDDDDDTTYMGFYFPGITSRARSCFCNPGSPNDLYAPPSSPLRPPQFDSNVADIYHHAAAKYHEQQQLQGARLSRLYHGAVKTKNKRKSKKRTRNNRQADKVVPNTPHINYYSIPRHKSIICDDSDCTSRINNLTNKQGRGKQAENETAHNQGTKSQQKPTKNNAERKNQGDNDDAILAAVERYHTKKAERQRERTKAQKQDQKQEVDENRYYQNTDSAELRQGGQQNLAATSTKKHSVSPTTPTRSSVRTPLSQNHNIKVDDLQRLIKQAEDELDQQTVATWHGIFRRNDETRQGSKSAGKQRYYSGEGRSVNKEYIGNRRRRHSTDSSRRSDKSLGAKSA